MLPIKGYEPVNICLIFKKRVNTTNNLNDQKWKSLHQIQRYQRNLRAPLCQNSEFLLFCQKRDHEYVFNFFFS